MAANLLDGVPPVHEGGTLGALLYAKPIPRVPEEEWVTLVRGVATRDPRALEVLYERMHCIVFTSILRMTRSRETAEELTVDVFHNVWRRAADYDPSGGTVVGWIMNQARSRAIDRMRYAQRKKRIEPLFADGSQEAVVGDSTESIDLKYSQAKLRQALQRLSPEERLTIETAYFAGLTHAQVAACLNEPLGTVKTRIRSGLSKLREALGKVLVQP